jgi:integrase
MQEKRTRRTAGIEQRHARSCTTHDGTSRCNCAPTYRASVWSKRDNKKLRKTFRTLAEAKAWRADATTQVNRGILRSPKSTTLTKAAEEWLAGAKDGTITNSSREVYKPSVIRSYEYLLRSRVLPELGGAKLGDITRHDLQAFADRLLASGLRPSTVKNHLMPVRVILRRAVRLGHVSINPTTDLDLPANADRIRRIASPSEALELLGALSERDRPLWATAIYAGLRCGEIAALKWEDVDLANGVIHVRNGWDERSGLIATKNRRRRKVPLLAVLRDYLDHLKVTSGRETGYVFGSTSTRPFTSSAVRRRTARAWVVANAVRAEHDRALLEPITLHEGRHTYASVAIAAGVNAKALSTYMGHSSIEITFDVYGHLMPGSEDEAATLIDDYLALADTKARIAQVENAA